jgi:hypothetical protein
MVQPDGRPVPAAMKPNETEPPTGTMAFQPATSPGPSFVTVYLPSYPVLQLEVWTNVARAPAANAG